MTVVRPGSIPVAGSALMTTGEKQSGPEKPGEHEQVSTLHVPKPLHGPFGPVPGHTAYAEASHAMRVKQIRSRRIATRYASAVTPTSHRFGHSRAGESAAGSVSFTTILPWRPGRARATGWSELTCCVARSPARRAGCSSSVKSRNADRNSAHSRESSGPGQAQEREVPPDIDVARREATPIPRSMCT